MTRKLYYDSPNVSEWKTKLVEMTEVDGKYHIQLEETAFYPEGGGQPFDIGQIDGINVVDVFEKESKIIHVLEGKPLQTNVDCKIDWERRFDHMQHHTGQHLLSATIIKLFDIETVSFHLGKDTVTIDLNTNNLTNQQLLDIEKSVNQKIYDNVEIKTYIIDKKDLSSLPLRKLPKVDEDIRIVEIKDNDISACCGTHVSRTGEIGLIKLLKTEKVRNNTRLHFKCGKRALQEFHKANEIISTFTSLYSTNVDLIIEKTNSTLSELKQLKKQNEVLTEEVLLIEADQIIYNNNGNVVTFVFEDKSMKNLQKLANLIHAKKECILLLMSLSENKLLLMSNTKSDFHCGNELKNAISSFNGKGGGNATQAQATFSSQVELQSSFDLIKQELLKI
ncbi:hypothetical protein J5Y03_11800 [Bacillus sp. RG28]|uniref:Alanyl-transfer RNA synthetases family profile domain-containing protein n=1 Tax=Gottfriedia endophytica TaxID=2820819 RepID=A0A940SKC0_9BACI|nr:DHHA1 domain-containing protein [Gottfriedia endophytica]MBP0725854.1 hypothetical protein [Gottfriedia endophytica]